MLALYIVGGLIALILILAAAAGTKWTYEKAVLINAPLERVWENVQGLHATNRWNPWMEKDPNIKTEYSGTDGTPGARFAWDSQVKDVGAGNQTIVRVIPRAELHTAIEFLRPFKGKGDGYVRVWEESGAVKALWGIESSTPYPMNIIKLFGVIEKNMDRDFSRGLGKLKALCEA